LGALLLGVNSAFFGFNGKRGAGRVSSIRFSTESILAVAVSEGDFFMADEFDYPEYDFDPASLPQELLAAIGFSIACANHTQAILDDAIGGCLGIDQEHVIALTAHMPMPLKISTLISSAESRIRDIETLVRLEDFAHAIKNAINARNYIAHDTFCVQNDTRQIWRFNNQARTGLVVSRQPVSIDQIKSEAVAIHDLGLRFFTFLKGAGLLAAEITDPHKPVHDAKARKAFRKTAAYRPLSDG
jgi:hypothetical protein